jgi:hypothetical protein
MNADKRRWDQSKGQGKALPIESPNGEGGQVGRNALKVDDLRLSAVSTAWIRVNPT